MITDAYQNFVSKDIVYSDLMSIGSS